MGVSTDVKVGDYWIRNCDRCGRRYLGDRGRRGSFRWWRRLIPTVRAGGNHEEAEHQTDTHD
jgi:hypothetical protein